VTLSKGLGKYLKSARGGRVVNTLCSGNKMSARKLSQGLRRGYYQDSCFYQVLNGSIFNFPPDVFLSLISFPSSPLWLYLDEMDAKKIIKQ